MRARLGADPRFAGGAGVLTLLAAMAVVPGWFTWVDLYDCDLARSRELPSPTHWFGFDLLGCDLWTQTVYGTRASLVVGGLGTAGAAVIAAIGGLVSGYRGGVVDAVVGRVTLQLPATSWGLLLAEPGNVFLSSWHLTVMPALLLAIGGGQPAPAQRRPECCRSRTRRMMRAVAARILQAVATLLVVTFVVRLAAFALPGDPIRALFGVARPDPADVAFLREVYGLDDPFLVQYARYLGGLVRGDLGPLFGGGPVGDAVRGALPGTVRLVGLAVLLQVAVGTPLGVVAGSRPGRWADRALSLATVLVLAIPVFVVARILQRTIAYDLRWLPGSGGGDGWAGYVLPALALSLIPIVLQARLVRTGLADALMSLPVRRAVASGLPRRRVVWVHALRTVLPSALTLVGAQAGTLVSAAVLVEQVFRLGGLGSQLVGAIGARQAPLVAGGVVTLAALTIALTLAVDLLATLLDPRPGPDDQPGR